MLRLFHFTIITDKMCLFRSADLKGRRTSYILLNIGFHYGKSHCRFKGWMSLSVYLLTYLFTYLSLMLIKKCPGTEKPPKTQWFVSMIHYPQRFNMSLPSFDIKLLIRSCLSSWRAEIIKCLSSHRLLPAVITTLLNLPFDTKTDWDIWILPSTAIL